MGLEGEKKGRVRTMASRKEGGGGKKPFGMEKGGGGLGNRWGKGNRVNFGEEKWGGWRDGGGRVMDWKRGGKQVLEEKKKNPKNFFTETSSS